MKAEKTRGTKTITIMRDETVSFVNGVTLTLSLEEAIALWILAGKVGGPPAGTIREYTDGLYNTIGNTLNLGSIGSHTNHRNDNFIHCAVDKTYEDARNSDMAVAYIRKLATKIRDQG